MQRFTYRFIPLVLVLPIMLLMIGCGKSPKETTTEIVTSARVFDTLSLYSLVSDEAKGFIDDDMIQQAMESIGYKGKCGKEHRRALLAAVLGFMQNVTFTAVSEDVKDDEGSVELRITFPNVCEAIGKDRWIKDGEIITDSEFGILVNQAAKGVADEKLVSQAIQLIGKMKQGEVKGDIAVKKEADGWKVHMPGENDRQKWVAKWVLSLAQAGADCIPQDVFNVMLSNF